jgi:hypothetical protein
LSAFGRPALYGEAGERLHVTIPASLAHRLKESGVASKQIATVLEDFLEDDAHFALVDNLAMTRAQSLERGKRAMHLQEELERAKKRLQALQTSVSVAYARAPRGGKMALFATVQRLKHEAQGLDDMGDVIAGEVDRWKRRMAEANARLAVAA